MPLRGFTLAEVLITLGIIGVVAALTIPTLMLQHRKQVAANRLKVVSSTLQQVHEMLKVDFGYKYQSEQDYLEPNNPDEALRIFNKYYEPYMKFNTIKKGTKGLFAYFPNGSAIYFRRPRHCDGTPLACTYFVYCVEGKYCQNYDEDALYANINPKTDNVHTFLLRLTGLPAYELHNTYQIPHNSIVERCAGGAGEDCVLLIHDNSWAIPDDYPFNF